MKLVRESIQFKRNLEPIDAMELGDVKKRKEARIKKMLSPTVPFRSALNNIKIKSTIERDFNEKDVHWIYLNDSLLKSHARDNEETINVLQISFIPKELAEKSGYNEGWFVADWDGSNDLFSEKSWQPIYDYVVEKREKDMKEHPENYKS